MSFEYLKPGPWMSGQEWDFEATEMAIRNLLREDKNYPYLQFLEVEKKYSLVALTTTEFLQQEQTNPSFKEMLASVELIHGIADDLLQRGKIEDLKERLDEYVRPHYDMKRQLAQKRASRRNLMEEFDSVEKLPDPVVAKEPMKTRAIEVKGAKERTPKEPSFRTQVEHMETLCQLISQLSFDSMITKRKSSDESLESALRVYFIGSYVAGGPKSAFRKVHRQSRIEKGGV